jgi:hypothetical protein
MQRIAAMPNHVVCSFGQGALNLRKQDAATFRESSEWRCAFCDCDAFLLLGFPRARRSSSARGPRQAAPGARLTALSRSGRAGTACTRCSRSREAAPTSTSNDACAWSFRADLTSKPTRGPEEAAAAPFAAIFMSLDAQVISPASWSRSRKFPEQDAAEFRESSGCTPRCSVIVMVFR